MTSPVARGTIKRDPEDFVVDEIPAYEPSGEGNHLFVRFEKRNLTTDEAVRAIVSATGVERREVGVAGLKDKIAVTRQWISLPMRDRSALEAKVDGLAQGGLRILERRPHGNKLKTGHLKGNAFEIVVRGIDPADVPAIEAGFERIGREGVPNAFGAQRFGREGDTHERARAWLTGRERAPGDPRLRRFQFSALQSWIFNAVLDQRVTDETWNVPLLGDLLKKEETGGMFVCTDVQLDRERAARGEVCPTGPIVGEKMRQPEAEAHDLEQRIILPRIEGIDLRRARSLGEGTRRALRLRVADLTHEVLRKTGPSEGEDTTSSLDEAARSAECAIKVRFVLPKGAYATTVLSNVIALVDSAGDGGRDDRERESTEEE